MPIVAYYPFEGNARDRSGANNDGTPGNITYVGGQFGQAALFNGTAYVQLPASNSILTAASPWSVCGWAKRTGLSANQDRIITFHRSSNSGSAFYMASDSGPVLQWAYHNGSTLITRNPVGFTPDVWHHVALTYDGTTFILYLDGVLLDTVTDTFVGFGTFPAFIGSFTTVDNELKFIGPIDEVRIYNNEILDEDQINRLFHHNYLRVLALSV